MAIRTILFDLDGTLVDSYEAITDGLNEARRAFGLPPKSLAEVRREVGRGLESLIEDNLGPDRVEQGVRIFRERYRSVFRSGTRLLPGVEATLPVLRRRGYGMGVTSNKPGYFCREIISSLGLSDLFGAVYGPEMVSHPKPHPEMILRALRDLQGCPEEAAYVGDMVIDIETAHRAGIPACVIPSGGHSREELTRARPDALVARFEDLLLLFPGAEHAALLPPIPSP